MKTETITTIAKIIEKVRNRTCIDEDVEVIKEILQEELNEYFIAISSAQSSRAYDDGYYDGYNDAYDDGTTMVVMRYSGTPALVI